LIKRLIDLDRRRALEAGFTTIRDVGAPEFIDVALRKAIDSGGVVGPRTQATTLAVSAMDGHAYGIIEIRKLVRFKVKNGAGPGYHGTLAGRVCDEERSRPQ